MPAHAVIEPVTHGSMLDQARMLLRAYREHLASFIEPKLLRGREDELAQLPGPFAPPHGALLLALDSGQPVGCIGLRPVPSAAVHDIGEICRLWVSPAARGQGLGWHLLQRAIGCAHRAGYQAVVLNSIEDAHRSMATAQSLYARAGFMRTQPYKQVPIPGVVYYRLDLTDVVQPDDLKLST